MNWTTDKPTMPYCDHTKDYERYNNERYRWYWLREEFRSQVNNEWVFDEPKVVCVYVAHKQDEPEVLSWSSGYGSTPVAETRGEWAGPIEPPHAEAGRREG